MTTRIQFDNSGESQMFVATRDVRNSEHANGTIAQGDAVFFRRGDGFETPEGADNVTLVGESGEPTNGNQYAIFATLAEAETFIGRFGLVARE